MENKNFTKTLDIYTQPQGVVCYITLKILYIYIYIYNDISLLFYIHGYMSPVFGGDMSEAPVVWHDQSFEGDIGQ